MDPTEGEVTGIPAEEPVPTGPPPEFLNPESPRYQPWAEKQITNTVKEKRPLREFMADFDAQVAAYGEIQSGSWDPMRQEQLLAKYSRERLGGTPGRRRRRRRPAAVAAAGGTRPAGPQAGRRGVAAPQPQDPTGAASTGERRRRRRRRPRAGRRPPETGSGS